MKKVISLITKNFGLKILAVVFAVIFWMIVVNVDDPEMSKQFSVPVTIENENVVTDMGKVYEVLDGDMAVFTVTASRSILEKLSTSDFKATADMSQIEGMSLVPIDVSALRYTSRISIQKKTQNMQVSVEDLKSSQFVITASYDGVPAGGCAVGEVSVTPNVITVKGAESVVSRISKVVATINVNGMSTDINDRVVPVLYDENGMMISADNLSFNQDKVMISATIENKKEIPIDLEVSGRPADGYAYTGAVCTPETLVVQGEATALDSLNSLLISGEALDITGARADFSKTIDITPYLPEGVTLVDNDMAEIAVTVTIEAMTSREISVPVENLMPEHLPQGMELRFPGRAVQVTVTGLKRYLDAVSPEDIKGTVDASSVTAGMNELPVKIEYENDNVTVTGTVTVRVIVSTVGEENSNGQDTQDGQNTENLSGTQNGSGAQGNPNTEENNDGNTAEEE
ncbi:MAG: hypothetical protein HFG80_08285 [Eubacterium sp.]|nr:hypothetical protein [Eubacterium sp.]